MPRTAMRQLVAVFLGLTMLISATVLTASQTPAAAQSDTSTTMLLFDLSSSMTQVTDDGRTRLAVAQQAMVDAISGIAPGSQDIGIRSFSDCGVSMLEHAPAPVDASSLAVTINALQIGSLTDISLALTSVAGDFPASGGRKSVILLSDGEHTCGGDPCVTAENLVASGVDIIVHAIGIGTAGTNAENQLACIASVTGGTVISVSQPDQLFQAIDVAIKGSATTALVQTAVPTCANSPSVQDDASLGAMTIGSTFVDDIGTTRVLILGDACSFGCNNGFDANCDGELGDFCNSDFDTTTVAGIGKCLDDLEPEEEDDDDQAALKNVDKLLERYCVEARPTPAVAEACELYSLSKTFQSRADTARAAGDAFLFDFNQTLADAKLEEARDALSRVIDEIQINDDDDDDEPVASTDEWDCSAIDVKVLADKGAVALEWSDSAPADAVSYHALAVPVDVVLLAKLRGTQFQQVDDPAVTFDDLIPDSNYAITLSALDADGVSVGTCSTSVTSGDSNEPPAPATPVCDDVPATVDEDGHIAVIRIDPTGCESGTVTVSLSLVASCPLADREPAFRGTFTLTYQPADQDGFWAPSTILIGNDGAETIRKGQIGGRAVHIDTRTIPQGTTASIEPVARSLPLEDAVQEVYGQAINLQLASGEGIANECWVGVQFAVLPI